jgi:hypothetical protein
VAERVGLTASTVSAVLNNSSASRSVPERNPISLFLNRLHSVDFSRALFWSLLAPEKPNFGCDAGAQLPPEFLRPFLAG